jgi:hypothetical protein
MRNSLRAVVTILFGLALAAGQRSVALAQGASVDAYAEVAAAVYGASATTAAAGARGFAQAKP